jgi:hypothetical protein
MKSRIQISFHDLCAAPMTGLPSAKTDMTLVGKRF